MMSTRGLSFEDVDFGSSCTDAGCRGNALFRVDRTNTGSSWQFNWEGAQGLCTSVCLCCCFER